MVYWGMENIELKFSIGEVVVLNSGGPEMTITAKGQTMSNDTTMFDDGSFVCSWFVGTDLQYGTFHQDSLQTPYK